MAFTAIRRAVIVSTLHATKQQVIARMDVMQDGMDTCVLMVSIRKMRHFMGENRIEKVLPYFKKYNWPILKGNN